MAVIFDCSSSMAMFRKPYTTTSSVSFAFPPPTAIAGLVAAIIGLDNGAAANASSAGYWGELSGTKVAVSLRRPIKWLRAALNFWNIKNPQSTPHIQVKHQFVAFPEYRVNVKGGVEKALRERLERNSFVYTPFLGVAYALAHIEYVGFCDDTPAGSEDYDVNSVIPWNDAQELDLHASKSVFKEIVPLRLTCNRALAQSVKVVYSGSDTGKLVLKKRGNADVTRCVTRDVEDVVAWFPEW